MVHERAIRLPEPHEGFVATARPTAESAKRASVRGTKRLSEDELSLLRAFLKRYREGGDPIRYLEKAYGAHADQD